MTLPRPPLLLHIGYPKTGTTTLQNRVFPGLDGFDLAMKPRSPLLRDPDLPDPGLFRLLFRCSPLIWRTQGEAILRSLRSKERPTRPLLISEEAITSRRCPLHLAAHLTELSRVAEEAGYGALRILMVIRRQDQWIGSYYAQKSDRRRHASQADFEGYVNAWIDPVRDRYRSSGVSLEYDAVLTCLRQVVDEASIETLMFEQLDHEPAAFARRLCHFLGRPESEAELRQILGASHSNARAAGTDAWQLRPLHAKALDSTYMTERLASLLEKGARRLFKPGTIHMPEDLRERVIGAYADANRRFAALTGLDLASYGYCPSPMEQARPKLAAA